MECTWWYFSSATLTGNIIPVLTLIWPSNAYYITGQRGIHQPFSRSWGKSMDPGLVHQHVNTCQPCRTWIPDMSHTLNTPNTFEQHSSKHCMYNAQDQHTPLGRIAKPICLDENLDGECTGRAMVRSKRLHEIFAKPTFYLCVPPLVWRKSSRKLIQRGVLNLRLVQNQHINTSCRVFGQWNPPPFQ